MRHSHPALAEELEIVRQQSVLSSLEHTLAQLAERVAVPEVRNLALLLIQSERLGADASTALLEFSNNQRVNLRQSAEATANRASFWMLFPSVCCLWVAAAIVLIGPMVARFGLVGAMLATVLAAATAKALGLARIAALMRLSPSRLLPWGDLARILAAERLHSSIPHRFVAGPSDDRAGGAASENHVTRRQWTIRFCGRVRPGDRRHHIARRVDDEVRDHRPERVHQLRTRSRRT